MSPPRNFAIAGRERDDHAAWHPDGKHVAIVSERSGKWDLYLVDVPE